MWLNGDIGELFVTHSESLGRISLYASRSLADPICAEVPPITSLFAISSGKNKDSITLVGITPESAILLVNVVRPSYSASALSEPVGLTVVPETVLPLDVKPTMIVPVDPMGWSGTYAKKMIAGHDDLVSVGTDGQLAFWRLDQSGEVVNWKCTGKVKTQRQAIAMAACSSAKKTVLGA